MFGNSVGLGRRGNEHVKRKMKTEKYTIFFFFLFRGTDFYRCITVSLNDFDFLEEYNMLTKRMRN